MVNWRRWPEGRTAEASREKLEMAAMGTVVPNKQVLFKDYVVGFPKESDMVVTAGEITLRLPEGAGNSVLVKTLSLSCDPYLSSFMSKFVGSDAQSFVPGKPIFGFGVAKVLESKCPDHKEGDLVWGTIGWEEYSIIKEPQNLFKNKYTDLHLSYYTGILGMPGLTAYAGFFEICAPKSGESVYISAGQGRLASLLANLLSFMVAMLLGVLGPKRRLIY